MSDDTDPSDDREDRSREEAPAESDRRRSEAPGSTRTGPTASDRRARERGVSGDRSPEWPYAPPATYPEGPPSSPPARSRRRPRNRGGKAAGDRSPEWPYAPPAEYRGESAPEQRRRQEAIPRMGFRARPDVDVAEHPEEIHVWCDLPGCAEETIELSGDEWTLYVSAERDDAYWEDTGIQRRERSREAERSISLPARTDVDAADASYDDGVLFVRAPKHESERTQPIGFE